MADIIWGSSEAFCPGNTYPPWDRVQQGHLEDLCPAEWIWMQNYPHQAGLSAIMLGSGHNPPTATEV